MGPSARPPPAAFAARPLASRGAVGAPRAPSALWSEARAGPCGAPVGGPGVPACAAFGRLGLPPAFGFFAARPPALRPSYRRKPGALAPAPPRPAAPAGGSGERKAACGLTVLKLSTRFAVGSVCAVRRGFRHPRAAGGSACRVSVGRGGAWPDKVEVAFLTSNTVRVTSHCACGKIPPQGRPRRAITGASLWPWGRTEKLGRDPGLFSLTFAAVHAILLKVPFIGHLPEGSGSSRPRSGPARCPPSCECPIYRTLGPRNPGAHLSYHSFDLLSIFFDRARRGGPAARS